MNIKIILIFIVLMWLSCDTNKQDNTNLTSSDILKYNYKYDSILAEKYENITKQIKIDAEPLIYSDITSKFGEVFIIEDSLHNQVFQKVNNDSNIIECVIWMTKPTGTGTEPSLLIAHQNKTYPMDYIRKLIHDKDYDNPTYRSQIAIIPILRIFEEGFQLNNLNTYITKEQEKKYMIEKYYNVLYIEKEWVENDYFMRIKLFVKQNNSDNPKSNI